MLIIATTSSRTVVSELGLLQVFDAVLHAPSLSSLDQIRTVLRDINAFTDSEWQTFETLVASIPQLQSSEYIWVGIKKLLMLVEMAAQDVNKVEKFVSSLQEECHLAAGGMRDRNLFT